MEANILINSDIDNHKTNERDCQSQPHQIYTIHGTTGSKVKSILSAIITKGRYYYFTLSLLLMTLLTGCGGEKVDKAVKQATEGGGGIGGWLYKNTIGKFIGAIMKFALIIVIIVVLYFVIKMILRAIKNKKTEKKIQAKVEKNILGATASEIKKENKMKEKAVAKTVKTAEKLSSSTQVDRDFKALGFGESSKHKSPTKPSNDLEEEEL